MMEPAPNLDWQDGQPLSLKYGDVYFSRESGLQETRHVFLQHNQLHQRWQSLQTAASFTIVETGFGTGLNFLCAWQLWNSIAPSDARLHFVSLEQYPLSLADMRLALALWPQLARERDQLLQQYQNLCPGCHRLLFDGGRVTLTLIIGDARDTLPQLSAYVDAWFLDGFAPAKNPEMWQPQLYSLMAQRSHAATTFATFTSAGAVKRGLLDAGFTVQKVAGYGRKREMLCGHFSGAVEQAQKAAVSKQAIVIGGGIAGAATSHALAIRGWRVRLIERQPRIAAEASGNPLAVLYPRLAGQDIVLSRLALHGYLHTLRLLHGLGLDGDGFSSCGLLQLAFNSKEAARCQAVARRNLPQSLVCHVDAAAASALAGMALEHGGLYFPQAGWIKPLALCLALTRHPSIEIMTAQHALQLERVGTSWEVRDRERLLGQAPVVVIAGANASNQFTQTAHLPLQAVRGQISLIPDSGHALQTIVCTDGYITPAIDGMHCLGATFTPEHSTLVVTAQDHACNLAMLRKLSAELAADVDQDAMQGRVALRCATPDYLPVAGQLLDASAILAKPPRPAVPSSSLPWLPGLYVNCGHGSKGMVNAPLCAELLASAINQEPLPIDRSLAAALDPNRFLLRSMGLKRLAQGVYSKYAI